MTPEGYWLTLICMFGRTAGAFAMRTIALTASDAELGREVFQAIRDVAPCDPDTIDASLRQFARDYPDPEKWLERYDSVSIAYRPKIDPQHLDMRATVAGKAAASGRHKPDTSLLPASSSDAEIGAHIRLVLEKVRSQSRPIGETRSSVVRSKSKA